MPTLHITIGALAIATASASTVLLATSADHDLLRSAAMIGAFFSVAAGHYLMVDRRMSRVEILTARGVKVEQDVLLAVSRDDRARLN